MRPTSASTTFPRRACCSARATATSTSTTRATPTARTMCRTWSTTPSRPRRSPGAAAVRRCSWLHQRRQHVRGVDHDRLTRHNVYLDGTFFACARRPEPHLQGRLRAQPHRRRRAAATTRRAASTSTGAMPYSRGSIQGAEGPVRLLHVAGRRPPELEGDQPQPGLLLPGHLAGQPAPDDQRRRSFRERVPAALRAEQDGVDGRQPDRVRLGRQDLAARRRGLGRPRHRASGSCRAAMSASTTCSSTSSPAARSAATTGTTTSTRSTARTSAS